MFKKGRPSTAPRKPRPNEKWCPGCKGFHPLQDFNRCASRKDGLQAYCMDYLRGLREGRRVKEIGVKAEGIVRHGSKCIRCDADAPEVLNFHQLEEGSDTSIVLLCRNCQTIRILVKNTPGEVEYLRKRVSDLQDDKIGGDS